MGIYAKNLWGKKRKINNEPKGKSTMNQPHLEGKNLTGQVVHIFQSREHGLGPKRGCPDPGCLWCWRAPGCHPTERTQSPNVFDLSQQKQLKAWCMNLTVVTITYCKNICQHILAHFEILGTRQEFFIPTFEMFLDELASSDQVREVLHGGIGRLFYAYISTTNCCKND